MKICLDTNVYSKLRRTPTTEMLQLLEEAELIYVPTVVIGELFAGFYQGGQFKRNLAELKDFFETPGVEVISPTISICDRYGLIVAHLRRKGNPIPTNDIWIAATAIEVGSRLISYDKHFDAVQGLVVYAP